MHHCALHICTTDSGEKVRSERWLALPPMAELRQPLLQRRLIEEVRQEICIGGGRGEGVAKNEKWSYHSHNVRRTPPIDTNREAHKRDMFECALC
ncbi:hypothetical protein JZ751_018897 [Albula glossodonta]|uniref:Uncharacterized protein n=1 Tax=Albula glossodonta TaxID=121402 RepID=A0A8T2MTU9_9TELE|nr:hypothetical protein JZ751_018897 [Albula glossodonta]